MNSANGQEIANRIATLAEARSSRRFIVSAFKSGYGLSFYVIRENHIPGFNVSCRVSDHYCNPAGRSRQVFVSTAADILGYNQASAIEAAVNALVKYSHEEIE